MRSLEEEEKFIKEMREQKFHWDRRRAVEIYEKWSEVAREVPYLKFKEKYNVKIMPPFKYATVRFLVNYKERTLSVFLDTMGRLLYTDKPTWEVLSHDGEDAERFDMHDTEGLMNCIERMLEE